MFLSNRCISMLLLSISCCFASLRADFITLSVWERTTATGHKQHLICCGDKHNIDAQADQQANDLVSFVGEKSCESDCILVEDMIDFKNVWHYANQYLKQHMVGFGESIVKNMQKQIRIVPSRGCPPLFKVGRHADRHKVRLINVEFRQLFTVPSFSTSWLLTLLHEITYSMFRRILEELEQYDDNDVLNQFYGDFISRYADVKVMLKEQRILHEIFIKIVEDNFLGREHPLYEWRSVIPFEDLFFIEALDARFLHNIYQLQIQQEQSNLLVVCAGWMHTVNIERVLPKLGYECIGNKGCPFSIYLMSSMAPVNVKSSLDSIFSDRTISAPQNKKWKAKL